MNYQEELNRLEEIIEKLNRYGLGQQQLKEDILLENIKIALIAFKERWETTNYENILNVIRSMMAPLGIDIIKTFPMVILGIVNYNKNTVIKNHLIIKDENYETYWYVEETYIYDLNITTEYIYQEGLYIKIHSPDPINHEIINKINFFGKGIGWHKWFNEVLNKKFSILINNIPIGEGKILWEPHHLPWSSLKNSNPWIEWILYHLWCPEISRFFQFQLKDFGYHNEIILKIPCKEWDNGSMALSHNYFYGFNYFLDESLPITINDDDIFFIKCLDNNQKIQSIESIICKDKKIPSIQDNTQEFYDERVVEGEITIQLNKNIKEKYNDLPFIVKGYFSNNTQPLSNNIIYENNDGSIDSIIALRLIHKLFNYNNIEWSLLMVVVNKFLSTYKIDPTKDYIINWWKNIKNYSKLMGYVNNDSLFNIEIINNEFSIEPKILFFNNRYQIIDIYCWKITISNQDYNEIFSYYINNFLKFYGINYEVIIIDGYDHKY